MFHFFSIYLKIINIHVKIFEYLWFLNKSGLQKKIDLFLLENYYLEKYYLYHHRYYYYYHPYNFLK